MKNFRERKVPSMAVRFKTGKSISSMRRAAEAAGQALRQGKLVLFPTETVYGIGCDAMNPDAVALLYERKRRPREKALLLHLHSFAQAESAAFLNDDARRLMDLFCPGPLSLILPKKEIVPEIVTAGGSTVGLRFPSNELFRMISESFGGCIAATSANISGMPSAKDSGALKELEEIADVVIDGGPCQYSFESTIVSLTDGVCRMIREGVISARKIEEEAGICVISD